MKNLFVTLALIKNSNMKELNKFITIGLASLLIIFACIWLFNHINAWIGIGCFIAYLWVSVNYLNNQTKQNEKDKI